MYLNLLHRPEGGANNPIFILQQKIAHELHLKVTLMMQFTSMKDEDTLSRLKLMKKNSEMKSVSGLTRCCVRSLLKYRQGRTSVMVVSKGRKGAYHQAFH